MSNNSKILLRIGLEAEIPILDIGEAGWTTDTHKLFIGSSSGNIFLNNNVAIQQSTTNGNIKINGLELKVYDDSALSSALNSKANSIHTHAIADIANLQSILDGKASISHTHTFSNITDVDLTNKQDGYILQYNSAANKFIMVPMPVGNGGNGGSTVTNSITNGNILIDGHETKVYDDTNITTEIGDLLNLQTTSKTNVVSAVNELKNAIPTVKDSTANGNILINNVETNIYDDTTLKNNIGTLPNLNTIAKNNIVSALNEVRGNIPTGLSGLSDVDVTNKLNGYGLIYDTASGKFKSQALPNSSGGTSNSVFYLIELTRWNISNDGTNATNTTNGINNAMTWAVQNGYTEIIFPLGTYLIDPALTLSPPSYFTVNLNGSTLQVQTNALTGYTIFNLAKNQVYTRITNGILKGERDTHDYSADSSQYGGFGIQLGNFVIPTGGGNNLRFISIDNLDISGFTGDAVTINSSFNQIFPVPTTLAAGWESGGIDTSGNLVVDATKVRTNITIDMTQSLIAQYGYFGLYGDGYGSLGSDITCDFYSVYFYTSNSTFISSKTLIEFFDEVEVPTGAGYAKIVLQQSIVPVAANCKINVRVPTFPKYVYVEKNNFHHNRRQGISVCGGKNIYIEDNDIHHIGGATLQTGIDPMSGIDVEDGYQLNQFIHMHKNNFHDNEKYNIICVNGKGLFITDNTLLKTNNAGYVGLALNAGVNKALASNNTIRHCKVSLMGEIAFTHNHVYGTQINVNPNYATKAQLIADNIIQNCKTVVDSQFAYIVQFDNNRFINDADKLNSISSTIQYTLQLDHQPQIFTNNIFDGQDVTGFLFTTATNFIAGWVFKNCRFKNIKNIGLVTGIYDGCIFTDINNNTVTITTQTGGNDTLELRNCKFYIIDSNNTIFTFSGIKNLTITDCYFEKTSGWMIKIGTVSGTTILRGNTINILNDTLARSIITLDSTFNGTSIILEDNKISSTNSSRVAIDNLTTNINTIIMRGNVLTKATINRTGKEVMTNNILDGIIDPYFKMAAAPISGYYGLGIKLENTNLIAGGSLGWICITAGTVNNTAWVATTVYSLNALVNANGKVYKCTVAGTSGSTAPSHTTGTAIDGTVTWQYIDTLAVIKEYGLISG